MPSLALDELLDMMINLEQEMTELKARVKELENPPEPITAKECPKCGEARMAVLTSHPPQYQLRCLCYRYVEPQCDADDAIAMWNTLLDEEEDKENSTTERE